MYIMYFFTYYVELSYRVMGAGWARLKSKEHAFGKGWWRNGQDSRELHLKLEVHRKSMGTEEHAGRLSVSGLQGSPIPSLKGFC